MKELTFFEMKSINGGNELTEGICRLIGYILSGIDNLARNVNLDTTTKM
ncbi:MAG TPA: hypothetical protein PLK12_04940 [Prolixibacteraceae bacterium]|nr:hypothetical protein [Prolixibacteraceae bacterium]